MEIVTYPGTSDINSSLADSWSNPQRHRPGPGKRPTEDGNPSREHRGCLAVDVDRTKAQAELQSIYLAFIVAQVQLYRCSVMYSSVHSEDLL